MLSMLGGIYGDEAVQDAMREYSRAWAFKHPSPWDYAFFMSNALNAELGWFWYYWLWTTDSVDGSIKSIKGAGSNTVVTVHQAGQMPSPVVLRVDFEAGESAITPMKNSTPDGANSVVVTWPVDVWFAGDRDFQAKLQFGDRAIKKITLDPAGRFPDANKSDNVWPRR